MQKNLKVMSVVIMILMLLMAALAYQHPRVGGDLHTQLTWAMYLVPIFSLMLILLVFVPKISQDLRTGEEMGRLVERMVCQLPIEPSNQIVKDILASIVLVARNDVRRFSGIWERGMSPNRRKMLSEYVLVSMDVERNMFKELDKPSSDEFLYKGQRLQQLEDLLTSIPVDESSSTAPSSSTFQQVDHKVTA